MIEALCQPAIWYHAVNASTFSTQSTLLLSDHSIISMVVSNDRRTMPGKSMYHIMCTHTVSTVTPSVGLVSENWIWIWALDSNLRIGLESENWSQVPKKWFQVWEVVSNLRIWLKFENLTQVWESDSIWELEELSLRFGLESHFGHISSGLGTWHGPD